MRFKSIQTPSILPM